MKFGNFEIYAVSDGFFRLDGGAMFGRVPKEVWKKTNPCDRQNRILLALRCLLIKTGKHNVLVDTGIGNKHSREFIRRFAIDHQNNLEDSLKKLGFIPEDIDIVINTHLHFDHCGGNTKKEKGRIVPAFPRAKYFIQRGEWGAATLGNLLTKASYHEEDFLPLGDCKVLEFIVDRVAEIEPGIILVRAGGHTKYHQIVKIESAGKQAFYLGDLVPTATHLNYPFVMAYDVEPLETVRKKMEILPEAAENRALLVFEHEPKFDAAFIEIEEKKVLISREVKL